MKPLDEPGITWRKNGLMLQCYQGDKFVGDIGMMQAQRYWYVWLADSDGEVDDPEGERFKTQWEAKLYLLQRIGGG